MPCIAHCIGRSLLPKLFCKENYAFYIPIYLPIIQKETFIEMQQISLQTEEFRALSGQIVRKQTE